MFPAVPVVVVIFTTVGTLLGVLNVTVKTAFVPSVAGVVVIAIVGNGVASMIVPVACATGFNVLPEVTVPVNVNVSVPSLMISPVVGILTVTVVAPAGIVIVVLDNAV